MKFNSKFEFGQKVYSIGQHKEKIFIECSGCRGEGKITLQDGEIVSCPKCHGRGGEHEYRELQWQVETPLGLTVGQIRIEATKSVGMDTILEFDNYSPQEGYEEVYMCEETGIRSGSLWNANHLFPDIESAQAECDNKNKGGKA